MQEITHYIASELKATDAALHLLDALEDASPLSPNFHSELPLPKKNHGTAMESIKCLLKIFWSTFG